MFKIKLNNTCPNCEVNHKITINATSLYEGIYENVSLLFQATPRKSIGTQYLGFHISVIEDDIIYGDVNLKVGHIHIK
jgi:hypothetical protein